MRKQFEYLVAEVLSQEALDDLGSKGYEFKTAFNMFKPNLAHPQGGILISAFLFQREKEIS